MIIDFVIKQLTSSRKVKNGIRYRDDFTTHYRKFLRLVRKVDCKEIQVSPDVRKRIARILENNHHAISFRLMRRAERKAAGCGPRMIAEPSTELKKLMNEMEKPSDIKRPSERKTDSAEQARKNRAAMGLGS